MLLTRAELVAAVGGLPSRKQHAAALAIEALRSAIEKKNSGGKPAFPTPSVIWIAYAFNTSKDAFRLSNYWQT